MAILTTERFASVVAIDASRMKMKILQVLALRSLLYVTLVPGIKRPRSVSLLLPSVIRGSCSCKL